MKYLRSIALLFSLIIIYCDLNAQKAEEVCYNPNTIKDTTKKSILSMAFAVVGKDSIKINYHSPGVRKRIIWGGLVPFDEVWVTGAHDATTLEMPMTFVVNGKEISAGKYAFFTIPGKDGWILIINKNWEQHLASEYEEKDDIIRIKVKPQKVNHLERLQYFIETGNGKKGNLAVAWENVRVDLPFMLK
jgi:hypothetical protein